MRNSNVIYHSFIHIWMIRSKSTQRLSYRLKRKGLVRRCAFWPLRSCHVKNTRQGFVKLAQNSDFIYIDTRGGLWDCLRLPNRWVPNSTKKENISLPVVYYYYYYYYYSPAAEIITMAYPRARSGLFQEQQTNCLAISDRPRDYCDACAKEEPADCVFANLRK